MKVTVNVECTPEEARAFLGLPDLTPIHDRYVEQLLQAMSGATSLEQVEKLFRGLSPLGDASLRMFSNMMELGLGAAGSGTGVARKG
jgi:hypothetical protein